ncbi:hypothetical protein TWF281_002801 [Arthrobotrys megalospora]
MSFDSVTADSEIESFVPYRIADDDSVQFSQLSLQTADQNSDGQSHCKTLEDFNRGAYLGLHSTKDLITFLIELGVEGPLTYGEITEGHDKFIGEGGQFSVRECDLRMRSDGEGVFVEDRGAVVKKPKWLISNSGDFDLKSENYAQRVHDVVLEVLALRHKALSSHRNIVGLIGWAHDMAWNKAPVLIFERALGNLEVFLKEGDITLDEMVRYHFCLDIAEGLSVLHQVGIAHGDLKPSNILVFKDYRSDYVEYVAKLADFGLSVNENTTTKSQKHLLRGWTPGWIAPEIQEYSERTKDTTVDIDFKAADIYSLGLVIWSVLLLGAQMPCIRPTNEPAAAFLQDLANSSIALDSTAVETLTQTVPKLLSDDPISRPVDFAYRLENYSEYYNIWYWAAKSYGPEGFEEDGAVKSEVSDESPTPGELKHAWYLEPIEHSMQLASYKDTIGLVKESLTPQQHLALFLALTKQYDLTILEDRQRFLDHLLPHFYFQSIAKDFPPAQGIAIRLYRHFDIEYPEQVSPEKELCWLLNAAVTGSRSAAADLKDINEEMFITARKYFRYLGGYNQLYSHRGSTRKRKVFTREALHKQLDSVKSERWYELEGLQDALYDEPLQDTCIADHPSELDIFHDTVLVSDYATAKELLDTNPELINRRDCQGFTAIYKACMVGDYTMVAFLCKYGADPTVRDNPTQPTCLHWLCNFDDEHVQTVADLLVAEGAEVDTLLEQEYINYHYPFMWPRGTALHWSIWSRNKVAVQTLLLLGANIILRDGSDPHMFDSLTRGYGSYTDGREAHPDKYSKSDEHLFGLNALDLAFYVLDAEILSLLMRGSDQSHTNLAGGDEEGFTPIHRIPRFLLSTFGIEFDALIFQKPEERHRLAGDCIRTWKQGGQNINLMTNTRTFARLIPIPNYTPLVISVARCDISVASAFLEEGADTNIRDSEGLIYTALHAGPRGQLLQFLLHYGVDFNAPSRTGVAPLRVYAIIREFEPIFDLLDAGADPECRGDGFHFLVLVLCYNLFHDLTLRLKSPVRGDTKITDWRSRHEDNVLKCIGKIVDRARSEGRNTNIAEVLQNLDGAEGSALHFAAAGGLPRVTKELLRLGLSPHQMCEPSEDHIARSQLADAYQYFESPANPLTLARSYRERFFERYIGGSEISKSDLRFLLGQWDECIDILQIHGAIG